MRREIDLLTLIVSLINATKIKLTYTILFFQYFIYLQKTGTMSLFYMFAQAPILLKENLFGLDYQENVVSLNKRQF